MLNSTSDIKMKDHKQFVVSRTILIVLHLILFLGQPNVVDSGRILFYMPLVSRSIRITFMPVASEMAGRGHEVVVITQHPDKKPDPNLTEITIDGTIFNNLMEKVSAEKLKTGGNPDPPLMEFVEAQLAVSINIPIFVLPLLFNYFPNLDNN